MSYLWPQTIKGIEYRSYAHYTKSPHWLSFKRIYLRERFHSRNLIPKCERCSREMNTGAPFQLHHLDPLYRCLGNETPADVEWLCDDCHGVDHFGPTYHAWKDVFRAWDARYGY